MYQNGTLTPVHTGVTDIQLLCVFHTKAFVFRLSCWQCDIPAMSVLGKLPPLSHIQPVDEFQPAHSVSRSFTTNDLCTALCVVCKFLHSLKSYYCIVLG